MESQVPGDYIFDNGLEFNRINYEDYIEIQERHFPHNKESDSKYFNISIELHLEKFLFDKEVPIIHKRLIKDIFQEISEKKINRIQIKRSNPEEDGNLSIQRLQISNKTDITY